MGIVHSARSTEKDAGFGAYMPATETIFRGLFKSCELT